MFAALSDLQPAERWREVTEALSADEMSALYQKMQASPALYGDDMHRLMHTAQQVEGRAANLFTRLCAAETAIEQLQRTRNVMEPAPVRFDFEADNLRQQLDDLREALKLGEASDGYHTHNELYSFRLLYNVHAALAFDHAGWTVVRSWKHSDGKPCFDSPDWFVVHMETPAGQITNHYKRHYWRHFDGIAEAPTAPEWDGHTSEVATLRLEAAIEFLRQRLTEMSNHADLMKRAYARVCGERDKYMRRTVEWRDVAQNDTFRQNTTWLVEEIGREHIGRCEVEQCDTCSGVLGIEEKLQLLDDDEPGND